MYCNIFAYCFLSYHTLIQCLLYMYAYSHICTHICIHILYTYIIYVYMYISCVYTHIIYVYIIYVYNVYWFSHFINTCTISTKKTFTYTTHNKIFQWFSIFCFTFNLQQTCLYAYTHLYSAVYFLREIAYGRTAR